tara:strand:+ start:452 stop:733 length:282 start_codon:yes stop_codon:yes gene_type:complete
MAISRFVTIRGKELNISGILYRAVENGEIDVDIRISEEGKRLDHYAYDYYGDASYWWVIAAASGIGWWLQVPPSTYLVIPTNLSQIEDLKESL